MNDFTTLFQARCARKREDFKRKKAEIRDALKKLDEILTEIRENLFLRTKLNQNVYELHCDLSATQENFDVPLTIGELRKKLAKYDANDILIISYFKGHGMQDFVITECRKRTDSHAVTARGIVMPEWVIDYTEEQNL